MKISFCIHNHQPTGNFQEVMESAYCRCYLPMLEVLEAHKGIRTGLHISGTLLEWFEMNHPEYLERISLLCGSNRMELLSSGRYEPIIPIFRPDDIVEQIIDYSHHIQELSGIRPEGLWLTERVWEPQLASILCDAGVSFAVVDDVHLRRAGLEGMDLFRPCITEDGGKTLRLLGSSRDLRYMIPFSPVDHILRKLSELDATGAELVFYGDDGEKFGLWPGTAELCYEKGWLGDFFTAVEEATWLDVILPSEAASGDPTGPVYVPAASYSEMGEWTLSGSGRDSYEVIRTAAAESTSPVLADVMVPGGFWRNFLSMYPESKELHGRILSAESTVRRFDKGKALHHLWRSQCNCAFWHGVFGGIYLPHLREAVWKELHMAEMTALEQTGELPLNRTCDVDADGLDETLWVTRDYSILVHPHKGLTVSEFTLFHKDGRPVPLGHVLSRRPEQYHDSIPDQFSLGETGTIHENLPSKEEGLAEKVIIDRWRRISFTDLITPGDTEFRQWIRCSDRIEAFQGRASENTCNLHGDTIRFGGVYEKVGLSCRKTLSLSGKRGTIEVESIYSVNPGYRAGMEICLNLMTGSSEDRFFRIDGGDAQMMGSCGKAKGELLEIVDLWRGAAVTFHMDGLRDIWHCPIESVNRSESGYESVHQGTAFYISSISDPEGFCRVGMRIETECRDDP